MVDPGIADCVTVLADTVMAGWWFDTAAVFTPPTVCASVCSRVKSAPSAFMRVAVPTPQTIWTEDTSVSSYS